MENKPSITDEEFELVTNLPTAPPTGFYERYNFTDAQITRVCERAVFTGHSVSELKHLPLTESQLTSLIAKTHSYDKWVIAKSFPNLTTDHIWTLLKCEEKQVRDKALLRANDVQKVWHHLTYGE